VIKADKRVNTIARAMSIADAQAELQKVFDAVQEATAIYKVVTDSELQNLGLEKKLGNINSELYVEALVEFIKKAESIVDSNTKNKEAANTAILQAQQLCTLYNNNITSFTSSDTIIKINEGIQAAIDAVKLYNDDDTTNNSGNNQIDTANLPQLIEA